MKFFKTKEPEKLKTSVVAQPPVESKVKHSQKPEDSLEKVLNTFTPTSQEQTIPTSERRKRRSSSISEAAEQKRASILRNAPRDIDIQQIEQTNITDMEYNNLSSIENNNN